MPDEPTPATGAALPDVAASEAPLSETSAPAGGDPATGAAAVTGASASGRPCRCVAWWRRTQPWHEMCDIPSVNILWTYPNRDMKVGM